MIKRQPTALLYMMLLLGLLGACKSKTKETPQGEISMTRIVTLPSGEKMELTYNILYPEAWNKGETATPTEAYATKRLFGAEAPQKLKEAVLWQADKDSIFYTQGERGKSLAKKSLSCQISEANELLLTLVAQTDQILPSGETDTSYYTMGNFSLKQNTPIALKDFLQDVVQETIYGEEKDAFSFKLKYLISRKIIHEMQNRDYVSKVDYEGPSNTNFFEERLSDQDLENFVLSPTGLRYRHYYNFHKEGVISTFEVEVAYDEVLEYLNTSVLDNYYPDLSKKVTGQYNPDGLTIKDADFIYIGRDKQLYGYNLAKQQKYLLSKKIGKIFSVVRRPQEPEALYYLTEVNGTIYVCRADYSNPNDLKIEQICNVGISEKQLPMDDYISSILEINDKKMILVRYLKNNSEFWAVEFMGSDFFFDPQTKETRHFSNEERWSNSEHQAWFDKFSNNMTEHSEQKEEEVEEVYIEKSDDLAQWQQKNPNKIGFYSDHQEGKTYIIQGGKKTCVSNKLNIKTDEPDVNAYTNFIALSPNKDRIVFSAEEFIGGDFAYGSFYMASLDGSIQRSLPYTAQGLLGNRLLIWMDNDHCYYLSSLDQLVYYDIAKDQATLLAGGILNWIIMK